MPQDMKIEFDNEMLLNIAGNVLADMDVETIESIVITGENIEDGRVKTTVEIIRKADKPIDEGVRYETGDVMNIQVNFE